MNFLGHIGAICAIRHFELSGRPIEVYGAESHPRPASKPGGGWDVTWHVLYRDKKPADRCSALDQLLMRSPSPIFPENFETYRAQLNVLLMLRDLPPIIESANPNQNEILRVRFFDTRSAVTLPARYSVSWMRDPSELWEAILTATGATKRDLFEAEIARLALTAPLIRVLRAFAPDSAAAPLPVTSGAELAIRRRQ